ncbi:unnamed protein product [Cochlearia groenlandica]
MAKSPSKVLAVKANLLGKREAGDDLETKPNLKKHKEEEDKDTTAHSLDHSVVTQSLNKGKGLVEFIEAISVSKRTLFASNLFNRPTISALINFFKDVGKVVRVQTVLDNQGKYCHRSFIEFASSDEANNALEKKNGLSLFGCKMILIRHSDMSPYPLRPKDKDYLRPIEHEETPPLFFKAVAVRKETKTLFLANLSPQTTFKDIVKFFKDIVEIYNARLIVNHEGKHVGYGFADFPSADLANQVLETKNGEYLHDRPVFLHMPIKTDPYSPQHRYNLAEKLWYEDYLGRESLLIKEEEEDEAVGGFVETSGFVKEVALTKRTVFIGRIFVDTRIPEIIEFFRDVGHVVSVRLIEINEWSEFGCGFVEFASSYIAKKAVRKNMLKEFARSRQIQVALVNTAPYPLRPKYNLAEKIWCQYNLGREEEEEKEDNLKNVFCGKKTTFSDEDFDS